MPKSYENAESGNFVRMISCQLFGSGTTCSKLYEGRKDLSIRIEESGGERKSAALFSLALLSAFDSIEKEIAVWGERENPPADETDVFNRVKCIGIEFFYQGDDFLQAGSFDDEMNDADRALFSMGIDIRHAVSCTAEILDQDGRILVGDDAYSHTPDRQPGFDQDSDITSGGESAGISQVAENVVQILHDLSHSKNPNQNLEKTDQRR